MKIPRSDWLRYVEKLSAIDKKAADMMTAWIDANGYDNIEAMVAYANGLTSKYGEAASALACEMYDAIAEASGAAVASAVPAEVFDQYYIDKAVRGKLKEAPTEVPSLVGRMVKQAGADTTLKNARRDGAQFAWVPHGDTCPFCIMLASGGWQYMSKKALKNGHAEHIHSNCDCEYCVRFDGESDIDGYDPKKYLEMYNSASTEGAGEIYIGADGKEHKRSVWQAKRNNMQKEQYAGKKKEAITKTVKNNPFVPAKTIEEAEKND